MQHLVTISEGTEERVSNSSISMDLCSTRAFSPMRGNKFQYKVCYWDLGLRLGMVRVKMKSHFTFLEGVGKMMKVWE